MTLPTDDIIHHLPALRRYACALTGSTRSGDEYIRVALEALVEKPWRLQPESEVKLELYALFHRALQSCRFQELGAPMASEAASELQRGLLRLSLLNRKLLLLVDLENLPVSWAAELLRLTEAEAEWRIAWARRALQTRRRAGANAGRRRRAPRRGSATRWIGGMPSKAVRKGDRVV